MSPGVAFVAGLLVMAFVWWLCSGADEYDVDDEDEADERARYTWKDHND